MYYSPGQFPDMETVTRFGSVSRWGNNSVTRLGNCFPIRKPKFQKVLGALQFFFEKNETMIFEILVKIYLGFTIREHTLSIQILCF